MQEENVTLRDPLAPPPMPEVPRGYGREIRIHRVLNGYTVFCGCQTVVFENKDKMLSELSRYFDNPQDVEKEYLQKQ